MKVTAGSNTTTYAINGLGQRVSKTGASTTIFVYDEAGHLIGEYNAAGSVIQETVWLGDLPVAVLKPGAQYYVNPDHLGSPKSIIDSTGATVWKWDRDPFGNGAPTGTLTYNLRFPGQYFDSETGLYYNMARDYNPGLGRYVQSDPIGLRGGINTYTYVMNDPVNRIDALGLYDMMDLGGDALSFAAGFSNAVTFGGSTWVAGQLLSREDAAILDRVERCSGAFKAGEWASLGLGAGRLAYAGIAQMGSMGYAALGVTMENAAAASAFRNGLKQVFRLGLSNARVYPFEQMVAKYGTAEAIIDAAGRTNLGWNAVGAAGAAGGAATLATTDECGCQ
ncbi:MAG: RHS repeat-associated core domain-containing protein [Deltaproteobacteria bacterium]|nr:RHS repeat-associated core domain-containing protein [Deltaproteobacteria bacterium]